MITASTPTDPFADMESDDFDGPATHGDDDVRADFSDVDSVEIRPTFDEPCKKCGGRGMYRAYSGRTLGSCFACKGRGFLTRLTSPESRAKAKAAKVIRDAKNAESDWESFKVANPDVAEWIEQAGDFEFARSLGEAVRKYGDLTDKQMASAAKCAADSKARRAKWAADREAARAADDLRQQSAPAVEVDRLLKAFASARAAGVARPKLNLGTFQFKPAPLTGNNPGAIYVTKRPDDVYLGKVLSGKFLASRDCDESTCENVALAVNDPKAAAIAFGLRTGTCAICSRLLTKGESIERGIGPICASRFGW